MKPFRLLLVGACAVFSSSLAHAMAKPHFPGPGTANLAIQPVVLERSPFNPSPEQDRDGDCIDDDAEHLIANHFRPYLIFDSRENARQPNEPVFLYRVWRAGARPTRCDGSLPSQVRIRWAHLYRNDGGFATSLLCGNSHQGDNQGIDAELSVSPDGRVLKLAHVNIGSPGDSDWPASKLYFFDNHHPTLYLSAGKHHHYTNMAWNGAGYPYYHTGCREGIDGLGVRVLANLEAPSSPRGRNNVGEPQAHPSAYFVNDLSFLGFFAENAWGTTPFCGGHFEKCSSKDTSSMAGVWSD